MSDTKEKDISGAKEKDEAGKDVPVAAVDDSTPTATVEETPKPAETENIVPDNKDTEAATEEKNNTSLESVAHQPTQDVPSSTPLEGKEPFVKSDTEPTDAKTEAKSAAKTDTKADAKANPKSAAKTDTKTDTKTDVKADDKARGEENPAPKSHLETAEPTGDAKSEPSEVPQAKTVDVGRAEIVNHKDSILPPAAASDMKHEAGNADELKNKVDEKDITTPTPTDNGNPITKNLFLLDENNMSEGSESGTEEEQSAFMKELENFFRERSMEFKPPKFYGEGLNCLKLWRAVVRLGGYDKVTSCKLWRQVGESFKPPKTCTTVSWTFRGFYEKALLDYERHHIRGNELSVPISSQSEPMSIDNQASGSGRARRDAAARAMQGWHSQRLLGNGEVSDPIIKDKNSPALQKREKQLKNIGLLKRKKPPYMDHAVKAARTKASKSQLDTAVVDVGPPADWVKINVQKTKDCYEVYALVPGLLREEVRVQSDPAGRLVISGEPEHPDNPWGVTAFKKIVTLPSRIDPHQTSAVVTLHGQLFVRVPFEPSDQ
ncbi:hypothetical protein FNV43_RR19196 [Rhamnella rubrinervis]|uniref:Uncharacterized protein n=1 Tax=Rhamnella rubrinervis TaxID=2594499 RepID=A0A8K0E7S0_9ROSA|nr:hypothetical protein FNV43_RR19196 [Rhamnella rubrinervis]